MNPILRLLQLHCQLKDYNLGLFKPKFFNKGEKMNTLSLKARITNEISKLHIDDNVRQGLLDFLEKSDFYSAPYTAEYEYNYVGGLAEYTLAVIQTLNKLAETLTPYKYTEHTLTLVGLVHAFFKINYFEMATRNKKVQKGYGNQWVEESYYKVKKAEDRYTAGDCGITSYMVASRFVPMSDEEIMAVIYYGSLESGNIPRDYYELIKTYPIITLLQTAHFMALSGLVELDVNVNELAELEEECEEPSVDESYLIPDEQQI